MFGERASVPHIAIVNGPSAGTAQWVARFVAACGDNKAVLNGLQALYGRILLIEHGRTPVVKKGVDRLAMPVGASRAHAMHDKEHMSSRD